MNVDFIGEIGIEITTESVRTQLAAARGQPITCRFFSEGGSVFEGFAISNALREYAGSKTAIVDSAFSIASYIVCAGGFDRVEMAANGWLMLHAPYSETKAPKPSEAKLLSSLQSQIADGYALRSGKPLATIQNMMTQETFLNAKEAVKWGFADSIIAGSQSMAIAAKLRDKVQAKIMVGKSAIDQWRALVKIHGPSNANKLNPQLRQQVIQEGNKR